MQINKDQFEGHVTPPFKPSPHPMNASPLTRQEAPPFVIPLESMRKRTASQSLSFTFHSEELFYKGLFQEQSETFTTYWRSCVLSVLPSADHQLACLIIKLIFFINMDFSSLLVIAFLEIFESISVLCINKGILEVFNHEIRESVDNDKNSINLAKTITSLTTSPSQAFAGSITNKEILRMTWILTTVLAIFGMVIFGVMIKTF